MAEVIRWSTGENMKNNTGGDTRLPLLLPCTALFTSNVHVGVQNSFDLSWNGRPRIGQHNRSCFEMLDLLEKCRTVEMAGFHSYTLHLAGAVTLRIVNSQSVITTPLQLINGNSRGEL